LNLLSFHELLQAKQANYKDWKCVLSEQLGYNVTWVEKKNHNTNHNGPHEITSPKSFVVGTRAPSSFTTPMSCTSGLLLHRSSALIKSQQTIIHSNKIFKTNPQVQTLHATFLGYASASTK
jgi:hypothetical protein